MGLFNSFRPRRPEPTRPAPASGRAVEPCDRCPADGHVRLAKPVAELREFQGQPHAVDQRWMDLVFCGRHYEYNAEPLSRQGWQVLDDKRVAS